ncbi:MAG: ABC transporter ATP-binding protein [bacterium]|nr:ABC transporter ATP-binding protein [Planctomycetota bacterium]HIL51128.1 ABC transporter ATP-binding protein [Planctomycetota bacterium]
MGNPTRGQDPAIQTRGLSRSFGSFVAVNQLSLTVAPGTFLGFLGANGAGKSTTIKMLTGLLRPSAGQAQVLGHDLASDGVAAKQQVGVVPEELALHDRLKGSEYLTFVGRMYGMQRDVLQTRRGELLDWMDLAGEPERLIVDYSHGMKKKLALAGALIHDPRVLFLDEPFEGIDVIASRQIRGLLQTLLGRGVTIFLTSHVLEVVEKLCTHIAIIHRGELVAHDSLEALSAGVLVQGADGETRPRTLEEIFLGLVQAETSETQTLSWLGNDE